MKKSRIQFSWENEDTTSFLSAFSRFIRRTQQMILFFVNKDLRYCESVIAILQFIPYL